MFTPRLTVHIAEKEYPTEALGDVVRGLNMQVHTPPTLDKRWVLRAIEDIQPHMAIISDALEGGPITQELILEVRDRLALPQGIICVNAHDPMQMMNIGADLVFSYEDDAPQIREYLEQFQRYLLPFVR